MADWFPLVSIAVNLLLGGTLLSVLLRHKIQTREANRTDFSTILDAVVKQRDEAWEYNRAQDRRIANMEAEIQGLRLVRDLDPFPNWIVDIGGEYVFVNREFERVFLLPQSLTYRDAIGKTHEQLGWPDAFCRTLKALDAAARSRPDGRARAATTLEIKEIGKVNVTVHKFPIRVKETIVAYAGFITDLDPLDRVIGGGGK